jgi:tetratricopeptide (TPR) repeat protein
MLERVTARGFETSLVRGQLGFAQLNLGRNEDAARNYERAFALGIPPGRGTTGVASYNLAIAYARLGRADTSFALLDRAVASGITQRAQFERDEDLTPLRADPRFQALLAKLPDR